jgi:hypothetical protein
MLQEEVHVMLSKLSLKSVLLIDAAITGATGLLMLAGAWLLDDLLDLPSNLLWVSGVVLIAYVAGLVAVARHEPINRVLVELAAVINVAWGIGCVAVIAGDWTDANALGIAFILVQIVAVIVFAALQVVKVRDPMPRTARNVAMRH